MTKIQEVHIQGLDPERLAPIIGPERADRFRAVAAAAREQLAGRRVLNVNSTATGGGVAEMLQTLLAYARGAGIDAPWAVMHGNPEFFAITKRIHNGLHRSPGDGGPLGEAEHEVYDTVTAENASQLRELVRPGDIVLLHDPQTAGLVAPMQKAGALVVFRCHVGSDDFEEYVNRSWEFLHRYLEGADSFVFTREHFAPSWANDGRLNIIPPSIDPFSPKNQDMDPDVAHAILGQSGLLSGVAPGGDTGFTRRDGTPGRVDRLADILQTGPPPDVDERVVVQVSRWDRLKDMLGVMQAFEQYVVGNSEAHLILAGPNVSGVTDDPEGAEVLDECVAAWRTFPHAARARIHLACLPMADVDENAAIVNALQRHADVVVQKSLAEGFGLTVSEALWKSRPFVGTRVGGIPDQVTDGEDGLLIDDGSDLADFSGAVLRLLKDRDLAHRLGANAHERARRDFLGDRHLEQYARLFDGLDSP
ncbi:MAG: glycosyltransferase [Acidimicrobiia bacterium]